MNKFVNDILKKVKDDDPFFRPKDMKTREEKQKREIKENLEKIKIGLQNIKVAYQNKDWNSEAEKLFLQMFSKIHLNEEYDKILIGYLLLNENNERRGFFSLENKWFVTSHKHICLIFKKEFNWNSYEIKSFMEQMLNEHFKLYEFISRAWFVDDIIEWNNEI